MICQIAGRVSAVGEHSAIVDAGALAYEVLVPTSALGDLERLVDNEVRLFTIHFIEGNPAIGQLTPRLIGFLTETERDFFQLLTRVKGISTRKALRAMAVPAHQLAAAIADGDEKLLTGLPEIGKRSAAQMVTELREHVQPFLTAAVRPRPEVELSGPQQLAVDILVQWGDKRADAQRWVTAAVEADPALDAPDEIVKAAYRMKQRM